MRGVRDLYSVPAGLIAAATTGYGATVPVAGIGFIVEVLIMVGRAVATPGHASLKFAWVDKKPTSAAELAAGEEVFGQLGVLGASGRVVQTTTDAGVLVLRGPFMAEPKGRRLGLSFENTSGFDIAGVVYMVFEREGRNWGRRASDRE